MEYRNNRITDHHRNEHGHVTIMPKIGQSFDEANDTLVTDTHIVFRHDSYQVTGNSVSHNGNVTVGNMCDAIIIWERQHNSSADYAYANADDPTECGFDYA